jgi:hypothetical protein
MDGPLLAAGSVPGCSSHLGNWRGPGGRYDPTSFGVELFIAVIAVVSLVLSVLYLREVK